MDDQEQTLNNKLMNCEGLVVKANSVHDRQSCYYYNVIFYVSLERNYDIISEKLWH